jgi:hypothetical protein
MTASPSRVRRRSSQLCDGRTAPLTLSSLLPARARDTSPSSPAYSHAAVEPDVRHLDADGVAHPAVRGLQYHEQGVRPDSIAWRVQRRPTDATRLPLLANARCAPAPGDPGCTTSPSTRTLLPSCTSTRTKLGKGWFGPAVVSSTSTPARPALKSPKRASMTLTLASPEH